MRKFRTRITAVVAIGIATTCTATAVPSQAADVTLKLVMTSYTNDMVNYYEDLSQDFENANPGINVEVDVVAPQEISQKVKALILSDQSPDIVNNDEFTGEAAAGLLYRADQIVASGILRDIIPAFINNSKYKGTAFAVPAIASANAFFWNKDILAGARVKKAPSTWDEMVAASKAIKKKYPDVYPYCLPLDTEETQIPFTTWGGVNGARLYDEKTKKYTINSKEFKEALDYLKSLANQKLIQPNPGKTKRTDGCWALFAAGKVGMVDGDTFFPDWLIKNGGENINWGTGAFPHAKGKSDITVGVQYYFKGYRANGRQAEIQKFLTFLFDQDNYAGFLKAAGGFTPITISAGKIFESDPIIGPYLKLLPKVIFYPEAIDSWQACKSAIATYINKALSNTGKALYNTQAKCDAANKKTQARYN